MNITLILNEILANREWIGYLKNIQIKSQNNLNQWFEKFNDNKFKNA